MRADLTDITILLDSSGSMDSIRDDTIGGFNTFVAEQKKQPGKAVLTLVSFNTDYRVIHKAIPLSDIQLVNAASELIFPAINVVFT